MSDPGDGRRRPSRPLPPAARPSSPPGSTAEEAATVAPVSPSPALPPAPAGPLDPAEEALSPLLALVPDLSAYAFASAHPEAARQTLASGDRDDRDERDPGPREVSRRRLVLPVLDGLPRPDLAAWGAGRAVAPVEPPEDFLAAWGSLSWPERAHRVVRARRSDLGGPALLPAPGPASASAPAPAGTVLTTPDAAVLPAALLAAHLGPCLAGRLTGHRTAHLTEHPVEVCPPELRVAPEASAGALTRAAREALEAASARRPLVVVAVRDHLEDELLLTLLDGLDRGLGDGRPWELLPRATLFTGRHLAALTWTVAKGIAAVREPLARGPGGQARDLPLRHFRGDSHRVAAVEAAPGAAIRRDALAATQLETALTAPAAAAAYETHGTDGCARGGDGVVLCGLRGAGGTPLRHGPRGGGDLACGFGRECPRGPRPLPLHRLPARALLLATCNSFRLADSITQGDHNLGLAYLDGPGVGYLASFVGGGGTEEVATAFLATLADGGDLAESAVLANGLLAVNGFERPGYLAIGPPGLTVRPGSPSPQGSAGLPLELGAPAPPRPDPGPGGDLPPPLARWSLDLPERHTAHLLTAEPSLVARAREGGLLAVARTDQRPDQEAVEGEATGPAGTVRTLLRAERSPGLPDGAPPDRVRVVLARWPEALEGVTLELWDRRDLEADATGALAGLERWLELLRLRGLDREPPGSTDSLYAALEAGARQARRSLPRHLTRLGRDPGAPDRLGRQIRLLDRQSLVAREVFCTHLIPELNDVFWLPNLTAPQVLLEAHGRTRCPACERIAIRKRLRHPLSGDRRILDVCPRCGIVSDLLEGGALERVDLAVPEVIVPGEPFEVRLTVVPRAGSPSPGRPLSLWAAARFCAFELAPVPPDPPVLEVDLEAGEGERTLGITFTPSPELPPHHYFLKALVAAPREVAFVSRTLFAAPVR